jgi:hypothetical protein
LTKPLRRSSKKESPVGAIVGGVVGVVMVAVLACVAWHKQDAIKARIPKKHSTTITTATETVTKSTGDHKNNGGSFSKATTVADNPRRNSSDRKSDSMLVHLDSGIIIDSVRNDACSTSDDIEQGATGTTNIIADSSTVTNAINSNDQVVQASSTSTTANDTIVSTEQHETSVVLITSDITAPVDDTAVDAASTMTAIGTDSTSDAITENSRALVVQPTVNEAIDTVSEFAIVPKKQPF